MTGSMCGQEAGGLGWRQSCRCQMLPREADCTGRGQEEKGLGVEAGGIEETGQCMSHLPSITQSLCGSVKAETS